MKTAQILLKTFWEPPGGLRDHESTRKKNSSLGPIFGLPPPILTGRPPWNSHFGGQSHQNAGLTAAGGPGTHFFGTATPKHPRGAEKTRSGILFRHFLGIFGHFLVFWPFLALFQLTKFFKTHICALFLASSGLRTNFSEPQHPKTPHEPLFHHPRASYIPIFD